MTYSVHPTPAQILDGLSKAGVTVTHEQWNEAMNHASSAHRRVLVSIEAELAKSAEKSARFEQKICRGAV